MNYSKISANIAKAEEFTNNFVNELNNPDTEAVAKTAFFMDRQSDLQKCLNMLQAVSTQLTSIENPEEESVKLAKQAQDLTTRLRTAISEYKEKLMVDTNTTDKDTVKPLNAENIKEAMDENSTTKNIVKDLGGASNYPNCNYAIVADGETTVFQANNRQELNDCLMQVQAIVKDPNSVALYQITYTPVPLKVKTILTV